MKHQIPTEGSNNQNFYNLIADKPSAVSREAAFPHSGPGMLSAALQGTLPPSHQPPTPPRTPQGNKYDEARQVAAQGMVPKMPSLFANNFLQQQMLPKPGAVAPGIPPLPSHVNKQALQGKQNTLPKGLHRGHQLCLLFYLSIYTTPLFSVGPRQ